MVNEIGSTSQVFKSVTSQAQINPQTKVIYDKTPDSFKKENKKRVNSNYLRILLWVLL